MRFTIVASLSTAVFAPTCCAQLLTVTSATASVSTCSGCSQECSAVIDVPCELTCQTDPGAINEFAYVSIGYNALSIDTTATSDAFPLRPRLNVCATSTYLVEFTLAAPTTVYVNWSVYWPPADNDFLPLPAPESGEWVGEVSPGPHFISANLLVDSDATKSAGLFVYVIPNINADCDHNGTPNWVEIVTGTQHDTNHNGIPDECESANPYDLDGDGYVANADVGLFLGAWGPCDGCREDFNGDGIVANADLGILLGQWTGVPE